MCIWDDLKAQEKEYALLNEHKVPMNKILPQNGLYVKKGFKWRSVIGGEHGCAKSR